MKRNEFFKHISDDIMPDIEQVRVNCINQKVAGRKQQPKSRLKLTLIIAVALTTIFMFSAFTGIIPFSWHLGEILDNLIFKGFNANKIEEFDTSRIIFSDGDTASASASASDMISVWNYEITDPKAKAAQKIVWADFNFNLDSSKVIFGSVEEAGEVLLFTPKGLTYLPEGYSLLDVSALKDEKNNYSNNCYIKYISDARKKNEEIDKFTAADIMLSATYVGENATIHVNTKQDIEQITLDNGIEALLMVGEDFGVSINWIKDGVGYVLSSRFDRDEMIKMAESVN